MTFNNTTLANELYPISNGTTSSNPFVVVFQNRAPTVNDIQYPIQKVWLDTALNNFWFLKNFNTSNGVTTATWIPLSSAATVETLTGNTGGAVPPDGSNTIFVMGDGTFITTVGTPGTNTLTIEPAGGLATLYTEDVGTATPSSGNLNVFGTGGITTSGAGNTITINGSGVITNNLKINVDAHTAPGTDPVVPDGTGQITVTGGQVAAGTTTNVIRTDSLAANTFTIEVQRSQAVASTTIGDNGVSHFNSAHFTVDGNGFVSIIGGLGISSIDYQVFNAGAGTYTYTPTANMAFCQVIMLGGGGAGGGSTITDPTQSSGGGGGGGGEYAVGLFTAATIGVSQTVTIGAGGTGVSGGTGNSGGNTSLGAIMSANGGGGGASSGSNTATAAGVGGTGGTGGSGGSYRCAGTPGISSLTFKDGGGTNVASAGSGASSQLGGGAVNVAASGSGNFNIGTNATGFGAGGSGAAAAFSVGATKAGGNGSPGVVTILEFIIA
jgi:hypothetical protein